MQDKSINNALLALRKQITRGDGVGLAHVEALLALRGVHMPAVLPAKLPDAARRGHMARMVMDVLRDGPMTAREVAAYVSERRPEIDFDAAHKRAALALSKLKKAGLISREGRLWLAP